MNSHVILLKNGIYIFFNSNYVVSYLNKHCIIIINVLVSVLVFFSLKKTSPGILCEIDLSKLLNK